MRLVGPRPRCNESKAPDAPSGDVQKFSNWTFRKFVLFVVSPPPPAQSQKVKNEPIKGRLCGHFVELQSREEPRKCNPLICSQSEGFAEG